MPRIFLNTKRRRDQWNKIFKYKETFGVNRIPVWIISWFVVGLVTYGGYSALSVLKQDNLAKALRLKGPSLASDPVSIQFNSVRHLLATTSTESPLDPNGTMILWDENCTTSNVSISSQQGHGPTWENCDFEIATGMTGGWITLYIIIVLIFFIALAIVCDDFFVPSLEAISTKLKLSEDVAGATFMAAGSSAPELFSSVAAVTFESDVGVGTIVGSAVFNLMVIISLTAAFSGKILHLDWRPLIRDSFFYTISIIWFIYSVQDTLIQIWEALIMLILYILYIVTMKFNPQLMERLAKCCKKNIDPDDQGENGDAPKSKSKSNGAIPEQDEKTDRRMSTLSNQSGDHIFKHYRRNSIVGNLASLPPTKTPLTNNGEKPAQNGDTPSQINLQVLSEESTSKKSSSPPSDKKKTKDDDSNKRKNSKTSSASSGSDDESDEESPTIECCECCRCCPAIRGRPPSKEDLEKQCEEAPTACKRCTARTMYGLKWIVFILAFPFLCLFSWTIPDCSKKHNRKYFMASFILSVLWIAALSFGMVTIVARLGCILGIDSFVMSLVILAAGTSIPDLISSIIVARDGFGDMAVSNAIGSNVFDIDLGLGLPFLIRICITAAKPIDFLSNTEREAWCTGKMKLLPHVKFGIILLILLFLSLLAFGCAKFRLNKGIAISFFMGYILFLVYAFLQEFLCTKPGNFNC